MSDWIKENSKWLLPVVTFIGGILIGVYTTVLKYESKVETFENNIQSIKDDIHDINMLIQNRILTKAIE